MQIVKKRPSSLELQTISPCFDRAETGDTKMRDSGIRLHEAFETGNTSKLTADEYATWESSNKEVMDLEAQSLEILGEGFLHFRELEVDLSAYGFGRGFIDDVKVRGNKAILTDYKFGFNVVTEPQINPQSIAYVLAIFDLYPDVDKILFVFFQPTVYGDKRVQQHVFQRELLEGYKTEIAAMIEVVESGIYRASHRTCPNCKHFLTCETAQQGTFKAAQAFAKQEITVPKGWEEPEDIYAYAKLYKQLEELAEVIKEKVTKRVVVDGVTVRGISKRSGRASTHYEWGQILELLQKEFGMSPEEVVSHVATLDLDKTKATLGDGYQKFLDRCADKDAIVKTTGNPYIVVK